MAQFFFQILIPTFLHQTIEKHNWKYYLAIMVHQYLRLAFKMFTSIRRKYDHSEDTSVCWSKYCIFQVINNTNPG